jgi:D-arabinose 1-dehydrogenase-like Zn-dependent alcohol dehydrogenase
MVDSCQNCDQCNHGEEQFCVFNISMKVRYHSRVRI